LSGELQTLMRQVDGSDIIIDVAGTMSGSLMNELEGMTGWGFQSHKQGSLLFSPPVRVDVSDIVSFLVGRGIKVEGARRKKASLEDLYASILAEREGKN
jgi:hypothetical protein